MSKIVLTALFGMALGIGSVSAQVVVRIGPPRGVTERRIARPSRQHVWIGGYQRWDGNAYRWEAGRWELPPRDHAVWVAPRWQHRRDGYVFTEGRWR